MVPPGESKPKAPPKYTQIRNNIYTNRKRRLARKEDYAVCECKPPEGNADGCGTSCLNRMLSIECHRSNCPCGDQCSNQRLQKGLCAKTKLVHVGAKGWGLLADEDIEEGALVLEYLGEVVSVQDAAVRAKEYAAAGQEHTYLMSLSGEDMIDATRKGGVARFVNHSCSPNCVLQKWLVAEEQRVGIFAANSVPAGTEICYNYNLEWSGGTIQRCHCGSVRCEGFLGRSSRGFERAQAQGVEDGRVVWETPDGEFLKVDDLDDFASDEEGVARLVLSPAKPATSRQLPDQLPEASEPARAVQGPAEARCCETVQGTGGERWDEKKPRCGEDDRAAGGGGDAVELPEILLHAVTPPAACSVKQLIGGYRSQLRRLLQLIAAPEYALVADSGREPGAQLPSGTGASG